MADPGPDLDEQIAYFRRKHARNPRSRVFAPLADLYRQSGKHEQALELIEAGLRLHPRYVSALVIQGRIHAEMGDSQQARVSYQRVMELDPDNLVVLKMMAEDAAQGGDLGQAVELLQRAVFLDPSDQSAEARLDGLRSLHLQEAPQEPDGVSLPAEQAEDLPDAQRARAAQPYVAPEELQHHTEGRTQLAGEGASAHDEPQAVVTKTLADIYLAQGFRDRAVEVLRQILVRHPERQDVRDRLAEIEGEAVADRQAEGQSGSRTASGETRDISRTDGDLDREQFQSWLQGADGPAKE